MAQKAKMDVRTGVAHGLATRAELAPNRKVRRREPPSAGGALEIMLPEASRKTTLSDFFLVMASSDMSGSSTSSNSCNPIAKQTMLERSPNPVLDGPSRVPAVAATSPKDMKTDANPRANTMVGIVGFPSLRSPAAVVI